MGGIGHFVSMTSIAALYFRRFSSLPSPYLLLLFSLKFRRRIGER
jgi:hypothetical protein